MLKHNWTWALLGVIALVVRFFAVQFPAKTEIIYSRSFFPGIRNVIDVSVSRLPFPTIYLFLLVLGFIIFRYFFKVRFKKGWKDKAFYSVRYFFNFVGAVVFFFLVLWGFNYQRVPIFQQLSLKPIPLENGQLMKELDLTHNILSQLRPHITDSDSAIQQTLDFPELEKIVRATTSENLYLMGLNFTGNPRTKQLYPSGLLRKLGILGIYFPFTGESYIDPTLHPLDKPFTIAHEMAHSYGVTNEGEANFIGWVICTNSDNPLLQYSGQLRLFRYQMKDLYKKDSTAYRTFLGQLNKGVRNDLTSIADNNRKIVPISLELSRRSNDLFLKTQGVKAGVNSYAQLTMLAYAWRKSLKGE
ncbi:DUF3810 domain-containing protein [Echinicola jeungdonensis]|uniref:DUF3810 domain-containing protein n=1 Tax=Echinicola jeungdonensis TaxID=709343 RepID=A0ABV5J694_9BACT|nr:DUF3810 domain-containing protein [Echinicola jeungdonensis]MDN3668851.1 DUF3810 domain-containing protein [Echinicola jeungdonensis]